MHSLPFRFVHWTPDPVMFTLGQRQFRWYAVLFVAGLLGGYAIAVATFLRERYDPRDRRGHDGSRGHGAA